MRSSARLYTNAEGIQHNPSLRRALVPQDFSSTLIDARATDLRDDSLRRSLRDTLEIYPVEVSRYDPGHAASLVPVVRVLGLS